MSRSRKHTPVLKDRSRTSKDHLKPKTFANRKVRRTLEIPPGRSGYKKLYESWDICDYSFRGETDINELKRRYEHRVNNEGSYNEKTLDEAIADYYKYYVRK